MADFIKGRELSRLFYREAVKPALDRAYPGLAYSAALIGGGSEVLGFDTEMSTDHHWGPRLMLFLSAGDHARLAADINVTLRGALPHRFHGYPTNFGAPDPAERGVQLLAPTEEGPVNHRVEVLEPRAFWLAYLGFDLAQALEPADWLTFPQQKLAGVTGGAVYHDGIGLAAIRQRFAYYPHDVWLYLLAAGWARIGQEEHLLGRAGSVGDELGAAMIAGRLARDVMRLGFLMERRYAPYAKWFGSAFASLACAPRLAPLLAAALQAGSSQERGRYLAAAYEELAARHNALGLTDPLLAQASPFYSRPFQVIWGERFAQALLARIEDPAVRQIAARPPIGSIDQWSDNTDLLADAGRRAAIRELYRPGSGRNS